MTIAKHDSQASSMGERLLNLAREAYADGALDVAINLFRLAAEAEPTPAALMGLASHLRVEGDIDGAIEIYKRILEEEILPANDVFLLASLGHAESERGNFRAALDYLWQLVAQNSATEMT
jgi:tetratricopeptide (TPR) repeat protein